MFCYNFFSPSMKVTKLYKHRMDKILHYFVSHYCIRDWTTSMPGTGSVPPVNKFSIYFQKYPISCPFQEILCFFLLFWNAELILLLLERAHSCCSQPWRCWTCWLAQQGWHRSAAMGPQYQTSGSLGKPSWALP